MKKDLFNIVLPGIFIPLVLGSVYNYSQYAKNIMEVFDISKFSADIGFSLIIFFLGMGAAVFGRFVEMFPKRMAIVSTILFTIGLLTISFATYTGILPLYYIGCSFMGTGTGIGYTSPIKQLLSLSQNHKGFFSGLSICSFGLGKFVAAPAIEFLLGTVALPYMFLILCGAFLFIMMMCNLLFKPNPAYISTIYTAVPIMTLKNSVFLTKQYISVWLMFCINISCGLAIISQEKSLLLGLGFKEIATIMSLTAVFNILGRFLMSALSDKIGRKAAYHYVCSFGIIASFLCFTQISWLSLIGILLVEYAYGGNFSCLPSLLAKRFGSTSVSTVHAMTLSGWAVAGIIGPTLANLITGNTLYLVLGCLYLVGFSLMEIFVKKDKE